MQERVIIVLIAAVGAVSALAAACAAAPAGVAKQPAERILVIGDSLEVGTGPYLETRLGERVGVYAHRGRASGEGLAVLIQRLRDSHTVVVFDLGSNDDPRRPRSYARILRAAHRFSGRHRCFVVATLNPRRRASLNAVIHRLALRRNVVLFDWQRITALRPWLLSSDRVHATEPGYAARARQLLRAIHRCPGRLSARR